MTKLNHDQMTGKHQVGTVAGVMNRTAAGRD
jgi:hypothetical protein